MFDNSNKRGLDPSINTDMGTAYKQAGISFHSGLQPDYIGCNPAPSNPLPQKQYTDLTLESLRGFMKDLEINWERDKEIREEQGARDSYIPPSDNVSGYPGYIDPKIEVDKDGNVFMNGKLMTAANESFLKKAEYDAMQKLNNKEQYEWNLMAANGVLINNPLSSRTHIPWERDPSKRFKPMNGNDYYQEGQVVEDPSGGLHVFLNGQLISVTTEDDDDCFGPVMAYYKTSIEQAKADREKYKQRVLAYKNDDVFDPEIYNLDVKLGEISDLIGGFDD